MSTCPHRLSPLTPNLFPLAGIIRTLIRVIRTLIRVIRTLIRVIHTVSHVMRTLIRTRTPTAPPVPTCRNPTPAGVPARDPRGTLGGTHRVLYSTRHSWGALVQSGVL